MKTPVKQKINKIITKTSFINRIGVSIIILTSYLHTIPHAQAWPFSWLLPNRDMIKRFYPAFDRENPTGMENIPVGTLGVSSDEIFHKVLCRVELPIQMGWIDTLHSAANQFNVGFGGANISTHIIAFPTPQQAQKYFHLAKEQARLCDGFRSPVGYYEFGKNWTGYIQYLHPKIHRQSLAFGVIHAGKLIPDGRMVYITDARISHQIVYWTVASGHPEFSERILDAIKPGIMNFHEDPPHRHR